MSVILNTSIFNSSDLTAVIASPIIDNNGTLNVFDGFTHTRWEAVEISRNFIYLEFSYTSDVLVNSFFISGHNIHKLSNLLSVVLYGRSDIGGIEYIVSLSANDIFSGINYAVNPNQTLKYNQFSFRVLLNDSLGGQVFINNIIFGIQNVLPSGIMQPYTPPKLSEDHKLKSNITIGGNFIGRSIEKRQYNFDIKQANINQDWFLTKWPALFNAINNNSFMYLWDSENSSEAVFCWVNESIEKPVFNNQLYGSFNIKCNGYIENDS